MAEITESRNLRVKDRIVTIADVRRLANFIAEKCEETRASGKNVHIKFSARCFDDSQFNSKDVELFSEQSIISSKRVSEIIINYSSYDANQDISIVLSHGRGDYQNYVRISGADSTWVNGTLRTLEEIISGFKPQSRLFTEYKGISEFVFALSIGTIYIYLIDLIPITPLKGEPPEWAIKLVSALKGFELLFYFLRYVLAYWVGIWPAGYLMAKLEKLWPSIELQIGPEHTFIEKRRRAWIATTLLVGVVPLLTSLVYDILKIASGYAGS